MPIEIFALFIVIGVGLGAAGYAVWSYWDVGHEDDNVIYRDSGAFDFVVGKIKDAN